MRTLIIVSLLLLAACAPTQTPTPIPPILATPPAVSSTTSAPPSGPTDSRSVQPTQPNSSTPVPPASGETIFLQVLSPQDQAVVNVPQIDVTGQASAGAVVTVNDQILIVGLDGQFKATVSLDEGPNLIQIVASDMQGNEATAVLTVIYEP